MQGNQKGHGQKCEKNHMAKREKTGNHFRRVAEIEKDHFADVNKMVSGRKRENMGNGKV